jgi:hypothetical protein
MRTHVRTWGVALVGPKAPPGKESNWVPTDPKRGFELLLRTCHS